MPVFMISKTSPRKSGLLLSHVLLAASLLAPCGALADNDAPVAAPGQVVPPHAAGGWPTTLTDDDQKPKRTPEQQARLDEVAGELKRLANDFGPDSVVLQSKFLIRSMSSGAMGPTEVKVAGPSPSAAGHLELDVETGLYFDGRTTTPESRRETVWKDVALPVLEEMKSFKIEPSALEVVFLFDVQDLEPGLHLDPTEPARHEAFRVQLSKPLLDEMVADTVVGDAVREKVTISAPVPVERPASARP